MRLTESMNSVWAPALKKGGTIGITAPSSQIDIKNVSIFCEHLSNLGYEIVLGDTITNITDLDYNSGTVESRAIDFNKMISDPSIGAVFAAAGGFGAQKTSYYIDYNAIVNNPKPIIGFSDTTFLLNSITERTGLVTFLGPTAEINDFERDKASIGFCLDLICGKVEPPFVYKNFDGTIIRSIGHSDKTVIGKLVGGNLTMIQTTLGTDYEIDTDGKILLLEEVGESSYSIERILDHLITAGKFDSVAGVVIGEFTDINAEPVKDQQDSNPSINEILSKKFRNVDFPVICGYNFSHGAYNLTLPLGCLAKITNRSLEVLTEVVR